MSEGTTCYERDETLCEDPMCLRVGCRIRNARLGSEPLSYADIYRNLDGLTALATAAATPLRRGKDEKDTAFVKRVVATYMALAAQSGVHTPVGNAVVGK